MTKTPDFEGLLPPNALPVTGYTVGYGKVVGMDEDGVAAHQTIVLGINPDAEGPLLLFQPEAAASICLDIVRTLPHVAESEQERKKMVALLDLRRRRDPLDLFIAVGYLFAAVLVTFLSVLTHSTGHLIEALSNVFAVAGLVAIVTTLLLAGMRWRDRRK